MKEVADAGMSIIVVIEHWRGGERIDTEAGKQRPGETHLQVCVELLWGGLSGIRPTSRNCGNYSAPDLLHSWVRNKIT